MITSKICKWWTDLRAWNLSVQREAVETQYKGYLKKLSPMRREHELRGFVGKVLPGKHVHLNPPRKPKKIPLDDLPFA